jgi:uncharacterized membrane protein YeiH
MIEREPIEPLSATIVAIMYFGDVVFAASGSLTATRHRMDILGVVLIGTVTGIGGGTLRDLALGQAVWWVQNATELLLCAGTAFVTFFLRRFLVRPSKVAVWTDALGLAAFAVVGAHVALQSGASFLVAAFLGMLTAIGGGVLRDLLTQTRPMILCGEIYATAALLGASAFVILSEFTLTAGFAGMAAFVVAFALRGAAILFGLRLGAAGEPILLARRPEQSEHP